MWIYVLATWPPAVERLSDLYPRWYGSRELLLHGRNPYSESITQEIQRWLHGHIVPAGKDEGRFAYPVYVCFLLWPTIFFGFSKVNAVMFWVLLCFGAGSTIAFVRFVDWKLSKAALMAVVLIAISSFPMVFAARLRQLGQHRRPGQIVGVDWSCFTLISGVGSWRRRGSELSLFALPFAPNSPPDPEIN